MKKPTGKKWNKVKIAWLAQELLVLTGDHPLISKGSFQFRTPFGSKGNNCPQFITMTYLLSASVFPVKPSLSPSRTKQVIHFLRRWNDQEKFFYRLSQKTITVTDRLGFHNIKGLQLLLRYSSVTKNYFSQVTYLLPPRQTVLSPVSFTQDETRTRGETRASLVLNILKKSWDNVYSAGSKVIKTICSRQA